MHFFAVSSPKCSLLGWFSTGLLIFYNKCFPSSPFISFIWCKFQITLQSIQHSHLPLKVSSKVIVLRASGERIPQFDKICSYVLILPEVPRAHIFLLYKNITCMYFKNIFRSQTSKKIHFILGESFPQSFDWWDFRCTFALSSGAEHNLKLTISILSILTISILSILNFCLSHPCWGYSRKAASHIKLLTGIRFNWSCTSRER